MAAAVEPTLPVYEYQPLTYLNPLRLLRLRPASHGHEDVDCELIEVDLDEITDNDEPPYEALSWCWGRDKPDQLLRIHEKDNVKAFYVSRNLKAALRALRYNDTVRLLWIDAICINQKDTKERNEQVPRMDRIYGKAKGVCIWLGEGDDESTLAINFIKNQVLSLWEFDKLIENHEMAREWKALITLMTKPWFSRRWVVQEIALSPRGGTLHCGNDSVPWQDFADAVSLFVEVESATHRVSDVMKRDQLFHHIPNFFGEGVSSLGAALLVDATSNLFRSSMNGERKPLSTLEYLISRLTVFEASQPRDTIYALLAISQDTTPQNTEIDAVDPGANDAVGVKPNVSNVIRKALTPKHGFASKSYNVDYKLPVVEVYREFVEFSIGQSVKTGAPGALDIICRPWAPIVKKSHDNPDFMANPTRINSDDDEEVPLPSWIPSLSGAAFEMEEHPSAGLRMERQNADPLVGMPGTRQTNYSAAGTRTVNLQKLKFKKWDTTKGADAHYPEYSMFVEGFLLDEVCSVEPIASNGNMPYRWLEAGGWKRMNEKPPDELWRTLVADRGRGGRNPPTYFPRACRESMKFKAQTKSRMYGTLDSKTLINEGRCTIVAEFLRRAQEVIWNRVLMKTKDGRLGLVRADVSGGYKVCILYGCSVPVILEEVSKSREEMNKEQPILFGEWQEARKRAVALVKDRWRMIVAHRKSLADREKEESIAAAAEANRKLQGLRKTHTFHVNRAPSDDLEIPNGKRARLDKSTGQPSVFGKVQGQASECTPLEHQLPQPEHNYIPKSHPAAVQADQNGTIETEAVRKAKLIEDGKREADEHENDARERSRVPTYYRFVGECYVHGMMNGEAIAFQNLKGIKSQVFELR